MVRQIHVYYSGMVQGVGFRFTAREVAAKLGIAGWVKNLSDARVEVVAEAEESLLKDFLSSINQKFSRYIQNVEVDWLPAPGQFKDFKIDF